MGLTQRALAGEPTVPHSQPQTSTSTPIAQKHQPRHPGSAWRTCDFRLPGRGGSETRRGAPRREAGKHNSSWQVPSPRGWPDAPRAAVTAVSRGVCSFCSFRHSVAVRRVSPRSQVPSGTEWTCALGRALGVWGASLAPGAVTGWGPRPRA